MKLSAYRVGDYVYLIPTAEVADPGPPSLLPIDSPRLDAREAMDLCLQLTEACASFVLPPDKIEEIRSRALDAK